eukprot:COSAG04_NODE_1550_length_6380_cov_2.250597_5_plen_98_part_00
MTEDATRMSPGEDWMKGAAGPEAVSPAGQRESGRVDGVVARVRSRGQQQGDEGRQRPASGQLQVADQMQSGLSDDALSQLSRSLERCSGLIEPPDTV